MHFARGLKTTLLDTALPYGFTVTFLSSSQILIAEAGPPTVGQVFLFALGPAGAYGLLRIALDSVEPAGDTPSRTTHPVRAGALHAGSILAAIGAAALIGLIGAGVVWPLAGFAAMLVYLAGNGVDAALQAQRDDEPG